MNRLPIILLSALIISGHLYADDEELSAIQSDIRRVKEKIEKEQADLAKVKKTLKETNLAYEAFLDAQKRYNSAKENNQTLLTKAVELERDLEGKMALLKAFKTTFRDRFPFEKGESIGDFTDTQGRAFKEAVVTNIGTDSVAISHSKGVVRLKSTDFPDGFRDGLVQRPITKDISSVADDIFARRPKIVYESEQYKTIRSQDAANELLARNEKRSNALKAKADLKNVSLAKNAEKQMARYMEAQRVLANNQRIRSNIDRLKARVATAKQEMLAVEARLEATTKAYKPFSSFSSPAAKRAEERRREAVIIDYSDDKARIEDTINALDNNIRALQTQLKRDPTLPQLPKGIEVAPAAMDQIKNFQNQLTAMENELATSKAKLYKLEDDRAKASRDHRNSPKYDQAIKYYNDQIASTKQEIKSLEAKIDAAERAFYK